MSCPRIGSARPTNNSHPLSFSFSFSYPENGKLHPQPNSSNPPASPTFYPFDFFFFFLPFSPSVLSRFYHHPLTLSACFLSACASLSRPSAVLLCIVLQTASRLTLRAGVRSGPPSHNYRTCSCTKTHSSSVCLILSTPTTLVYQARSWPQALGVGVTMLRTFIVTSSLVMLLLDQQK